ncbi:dsRBD fold-containing protein [Nonomuraea sp. MTCD27]|uniref:dsRBD fold-containing protein n=1 Tax=Nonomuraea sp. MTCD27 TaxID=1676747 RepID=UPI0035C21EC8
MTRPALFDLDRTLLDLDAAFVLWAGEFAERHRLTEGAVERLEGFHARMPHLAELYAGVPEALTWLRAAGWRVGVVTNGPARRQLAKIRRTGLDDRTARSPQARPLSPNRWKVYRRPAGQPARGGGGVVMEAKEWTVRISLAEDGDDTAARATLTMGNGDRVTGTGRARRNPADPAVPEIGDELAASRALADLAERLAVITKHDISETTAESPAPTRSW